MTPDEIQQARETAQFALSPVGGEPTPGEIGQLARALLALTEHQPEPVSRDELVGLIEQLYTAGEDGMTDEALADYLLARYNVTRKAGA